MTRLLRRVGTATARHPWSTIAVWAVIAIAIVGAGRAAGGSFNNSVSIPGTDSQAAVTRLQHDFPARAGATQPVVFHSTHPTLDDPTMQSAINSSLRTAATLPGVGAVAAPGKGGGPVSKDHTTAIASLSYTLPSSRLHASDFSALEAAMRPATSAGIEVNYGGDLVSSVQRPGTGNSDKIGLVVALLVLVIAFGSVVAAGVPIGTAIIGLAIGLSVVKLLTSVTHVPSTTTTLGTMIGLGVGIDYALFVVTRFREELATGATVPDAAGQANATAGASVLFAGTTVVIAICGLAIAGIPFVTTLGLATAAVVAIAVTVALTLLPALCGLAGHHIDSLRIHGGRHPDANATAEPGMWERWAGDIAAHPWPYVAATLVVLLALAAPLLSMRLGQTDASTLPTSSTQRRAYDLISTEFGPGYNGPLKIALELPAHTPSTAVSSVAAAVGRAPGVAATSNPQVSASGDTAVLTVIPTTAPQAAATTSLVHHLRNQVLPAATAHTGITALVAGSTASYVDLAARIAARLPLFIAAVVGLSFLLLMMVFRSVLVPLKAAIMNALSVGAGYGIIVAVFQWGWLRDVVGLRETVPVVSWVPMMMFAILFGLSMDYEVFLLSRVREEWLRTRDSRHSVVHGIDATGRVITSAAVIMVSVFASFVLIDDPVVKMVGVGLAASVLVDATIIRMILVPATMELLGDSNWWMPQWLARLLPSIELESAREARPLTPQPA